jgi:lipopolysaccharide transport system permease protein
VPLMLYYGYVPAVGALFWIPFLSVVVAFQALGLSLFFSALNVRFRDVGNLIPYALQMALWLTPITYPLSLVPERYRMWVCLNPVVGVVEGFRSAFLGRPMDMSLVGISVGAAIVFMLGGLYYFRKVESTFADVA